jgi:hypothetical protein
MDPSLDREKELLRVGPKRVDCRGSLCVWNDLEIRGDDRGGIVTMKRREWRFSVQIKL